MEEKNYRNNKDEGFIGFLKGTRSLSSAFWFIGVIPAVAIFLIFLAIREGSTPDFKTLSIVSFFTVLIQRLFAWFSIIKCRKNSSNPIWGSLAVTIVVIDIVYKALISTIFLNKLYELENKKQLKSEVLRKCQQEVSLIADCPLEEIEVYNNQYYSNGRAHYVLKHEERRFMCFTGKDSIEVKEHE